MKKQISIVILTLLIIFLIFAIKEKHYIEIITNKYLYSDNATLPSNPKIKKNTLEENNFCTYSKNHIYYFKQLKIPLERNNKCLTI